MHPTQIYKPDMKEKKSFVPAQEAYNLYAKYYDLTTAWHTKDLPLYGELAENASPPYLEVGCGTGRVVDFLLNNKAKGSKGPYLTGVDISSLMLREARLKNKKFLDEGSLSLIEHNFVESSLNRQFNAAFVTFYTINYIPQEVQRTFLENIRNSLSPNGVIAIDFFYPPLKLAPENEGRWIEKEPVITHEGAIMFREKSQMITPENEEREWVFTEPSGEEVSIQTNRLYISPQKGKELLEAAGFTDVKRVKNYALPGDDDFSENSLRYNFVLTARNGKST